MSLKHDHHNLAEDNEAAIRATNDDAFSSKLAASDAGYFTDTHLMALYRRSHSTKPTRSPVINRGTYARVALKNSLLQSFLSFPNNQIISIGAGFDTAPFKTAAHRFLELDFPEVVMQKVRLARGVIESVYDHVTATKDSVTAMRTSSSGTFHYALRACDILNLTALSKTLASASIDPAMPTLILAEIVLVYLEPEDGDELLKFLSNYFTKTRAVAILEHTNLHDPFGETMARNISARGCPLLSLSKYPTPESLVERFKSVGFTHVRAETMMQAFRKRFSEEQERGLQQVQLLDEVEEFELLLKHYVVLVAVAGDDAEVVLERLELSRLRGTPFR